MNSNGSCPKCSSINVGQVRKTDGNVIITSSHSYTTTSTSPSTKPTPVTSLPQEYYTLQPNQIILDEFNNVEGSLRS